MYRMLLDFLSVSHRTELFNELVASRAAWKSSLAPEATLSTLMDSASDLCEEEDMM